jgi:hypothetical protein
LSVFETHTYSHPANHDQIAKITRLSSRDRKWQKDIRRRQHVEPEIVRQNTDNQVRFTVQLHGFAYRRLCRPKCTPRERLCEYGLGLFSRLLVS